mgnify:CR=1 FL=1
MREILFRAKRLKDKIWVEGSLLVLDADSGYYFITQPYKSASTLPVKDLIYNHTHLVDPETVCQFTGMIDKNGAKVFEGDIIRIITFGFDKELFVTNVKFGARSGVQGFYLANGRSMFYFGQTDLSRMDDGEVIGNIFDNPELLKGGAE